MYTTWNIFTVFIFPSTIIYNNSQKNSIRNPTTRIFTKYSLLSSYSLSRGNKYSLIVVFQTRLLGNVTRVKDIVSAKLIIIDRSTMWQIFGRICTRPHFVMCLNFYKNVRRVYESWKRHIWLLDKYSMNPRVVTRGNGILATWQIFVEYDE